MHNNRYIHTLFTYSYQFADQEIMAIRDSLNDTSFSYIYKYSVCIVLGTQVRDYTCKCKYLMLYG